jgi:CBS domain-containing protein
VLEDTYFYLLPKQHFLEICDRHEAFTEYFTDIFGKRMLDRSYADIVAQSMRPKQDGLQFFSQPVANIFTQNAVTGDTALNIQGAARLMRDRKISSLFIVDDRDRCKGVVTERDLTEKVIAAGYGIDRPVADIMSSPVRTISDQALLFEAMMVMMQEDIRHLAVVGADDQFVGVLSSRDLLAAQGQSPLFLLREISEAAGFEEVVSRHQQLPKMVGSLITGGAKARNVTRFITAISDAILEKIIGYALDEHGPPPARFAFIVMGSEGRREQTLKTDQDNAIIYEDVPDGDEPGVRDYFLKFGDTVCTMLDRAGYDFCKGDVMAKNPRWCQSISAWKDDFSQWIHAAEPEDLLQASIFFDFRLGHGDSDLVDTLRRHLFGSLGGWAGFFRHLTINTLRFKLPIGFFRNFVVESKGKHRDAFDIKGVMSPIVDFARIYALKHRMEETNTLERLQQLNLKKVLSHEEFEELDKAYSFLLQIRFFRQVTMAVDEKAPPDNYVNPKKLTGIEQKMLKEIFRRIEKFQTKLEFEFVGMV